MSDERPGQLVVDASVVVKLFLSEALSERAGALFAAHPESGSLRAPSLLYSECANVLWKYVRRAALGRATAEAHMNEILAMRITPAPVESLAAAALPLAIQHDITAYDATYVALAQSLTCNLITADQRLVNKLSPNLPFVRWLGDPAMVFGDDG